MKSEIYNNCMELTHKLAKNGTHVAYVTTLMLMSKMEPTPEQTTEITEKIKEYGPNLKKKPDQIAVEVLSEFIEYGPNENYIDRLVESLIEKKQGDDKDVTT